jgi:hypothetical protein
MATAQHRSTLSRFPRFQVTADSEELLIPGAQPEAREARMGG